MEYIIELNIKKQINSDIKTAIYQHKDSYGDNDEIIKLDLDSQENAIFNAGYLEGLREALRLVK